MFAALAALCAEKRFSAHTRSHARKLTLAASDVKCGLIGGNAIGSCDRKLLPVCAFRDRGCQAPTI